MLSWGVAGKHIEASMLLLLISDIHLNSANSQCIYNLACDLTVITPLYCDKK